jgi:hypothetical protein
MSYFYQTWTSAKVLMPQTEQQCIIPNPVEGINSRLGIHSPILQSIILLPSFFFFALGSITRNHPKADLSHKYTAIYHYQGLFSTCLSISPPVFALQSLSKLNGCTSFCTKKVVHPLLKCLEEYADNEAPTHPR